MKKIIKLIICLIISIGIVFVIMKNINFFNKQEVNEVQLVDASINILVVNPDYFNPLVSKNKYVQDMNKLIFDGLTVINSELKAENCLAKIVEPKESSKEYRIVLKNNIKFHDGSELTSDDVIFTINKILKLKEESPYYYNVMNIASVNKVNKHELKITLNNVDNFMPEKLSFPILPERYYANKDLTTTNTIVGTGRYKVENTADNEWTLVYNNNYHEDRKGNITTIKAKILNKNIQGFEALKSGDIDMVDTNVEVGAYGRSAFYSKRYNTGVFEGIIFNLANEEVKDQNVRQAILLAINRDSIIENYLGGYAKSVAIPINPSSNLFDESLPSYAYNPEKAEDILTNTGWELDNNNVRVKDKVSLNIDFLINEDKEHAKEKAEFIASNLKNIGINVNIVSKTTDFYNAAIKNGEYDIVLTEWALSPYPEFLYFFETNNEKNYSGFSNEDYDYLVYMAKREVIDVKLQEYFSDMQEILNSYLPMACLYVKTSTVYYSKDIKGEMKSNVNDIYRGVENMIKSNQP